MKILLKNCTLPNYKKVNILLEDSVFAEFCSNVFRVKPHIYFAFAVKLFFPFIIYLSQNIFSTFDDKDKISDESESFLKGSVTSLINMEK